MQREGILKDIKRKLILGLPIALTAIIIDRITKLSIVHFMRIYESKDVLGNFFRLTYVTNPYASFSLKFGNYYIMIGLTILAIIFIFMYFIKSPYLKARIISLSMILGGAFGNLYDRLISREVVDFLDFGIGKHRFATFNMADTSIFLGVCLLIILVFFEKNEQTAD